MKDNWQPFQLPDGSYSDPTRPWSHQDLVNYLPMQAEMAGTRSGVLLRTVPGLKLIAQLGTGPIRGIRDVEGTRFIVSGTKLYRLNADGSNDELGTIPGTGPVPMTHNQVAGGNQLVIGAGSNGYIYDTRDESMIPENEGGTGPNPPVDPDDPDAPEDPDIPVGGETFAVSGTWPAAYVGVPYRVRNGDAGLVITGGETDASAYGEVVPGVGAYATVPLSDNYVSIGIPFAAGTAASDLSFDASASSPGATGNATVTASVTVNAKPTYSPIDLRVLPNYGCKLVATTPSFTTFDLDNGNTPFGCYGFSAGTHRGEFTITGMASPFFVGVHVGKGEYTATDSPVVLGFAMPNTASVSVLADGTYWVEYDAGTGAYAIGKVGGATLDSGTLALPGGNLARLVISTDYVQSARVKCNFGNEAWVGTPTMGYTGVPFPTTSVLVAWGKPVPINGKMRNGNGFVGATEATRGVGSHHMPGTFGKSSGKWRVQLAGSVGATARIGLAVAAYSYTQGALGAAGTSDSIGWDGSTLYWCLGGVTGSTAATVLAGTDPVFAIDFTAATVGFYKQELDGTFSLVHSIPSVPAGTWFPIECNCGTWARIKGDPSGPATYSDWAVTI